MNSNWLINLVGRVFANGLGDLGRKFQNQKQQNWLNKRPIEET